MEDEDDMSGPMMPSPEWMQNAINTDPEFKKFVESMPIPDGIPREPWMSICKDEKGNK